MNKKKFKTMIKDNSQAFFDYSSSKMLFGSKFEETAAKLLLLKAKSKEFFGALSRQQY